MLKILYTIILFGIYLNLSGQTTAESIMTYQSGKIYWKGQNYCDTSTGSKICVPFGNWNYWYENGQKKLETVVIAGKYKYSPNVKYINMWLYNGKQILKDGTGFYYDNTSGPMPAIKDSLVFEIKDSIKQGSFRIYRMYPDSKYFLVESGQYANSERVGLFKYKDTTLLQLVVKETLYENENETCDYKRLHTNFKVSEEGKMINGEKEGLWKYYTMKGKLWKEVTFKKGVEIDSKELSKIEQKKSSK